MPAPKLLTAILLAVLSLALAACGGGDEEAESTATPGAATETQPGETEVGCRKVEAPEPKGAQDLPKPDLRLDPEKTYVATISTNCGDFEITLDVKRAPKTSASVTYMARKGLYDGTTFHRIVPGFVIQGGDPLGNGTGGPGYSVREAPPRDLQYTRGVVAMAKTGTEPAGTSGSQFFVVTGEDAGLPPEYALLGEVTSGAEVVDAIGTAQTDPATEQPADPVVIESFEVTER